MKNKKAMIPELLVKILIGIAILLILIAVYIIATGKGAGFLAKIKDVFTFRV